MLTLINKVDQTNNIPFESIKIDTVAGDPNGKATFQLIDPGSQITLTSLQEVIFWDETVAITPSGGVLTTSVPAHNYLGNNYFYFAGGGWTSIGTLSGRISYPVSGTPPPNAYATLTFSNQAVGSALSAQTVTNSSVSGKSYAIPGQTYCLSALVTVTSTFTNSFAFFELIFKDASGATLSTTASSSITTTSGQQRFSLQATAPAGTVTLQVAFGGTTTSTTNSGIAQFTAFQLEPVWWPALYQYPTPLCDAFQSDCITLPDSTCSRFDRIFTGNITHLIVSYDGTTRIYDVEVTNLDGWLENVTLVNASYSNVTDQSIITGILDNLPNIPIYAATPSLATGTPSALAFRNVPIVYAGVTVNSIEYADATVREVMDSLADITGFLFGVDQYYNIFYYPPFYNAAPYGFSSSPDNVTTFSYYDYSIEYDGSQLQNALNVSGNTYEKQVTEAFTAGDGSHAEVHVSGKLIAFFLFQIPSGTLAIPQVTFGSTLQTTYLDTGAGWTGTATTLVGLPANKIAILNPQTLGTSISVTYTYTALVYAQTQSPDSVAKFGRPLYAKINDTNLASNAQAVTRGEAQLQAYAQDRITLKFKTQKLVYPGQVIEITSAQDNLTKAHYAVQKVSATYLGNGINQYEVEAGTYVDDFVDFFRNTQKAVNRATHDPAAPIQQYNNLQQDSASYTDSLNIHL